MKKSISALIMASIMTLCLTSCGEKKEKITKIGVIQLVEHLLL